ncbi:simple sugar transport system permease protein [Rhizobium mesoamericanum]|uniref:ABC transporter permease n=1 Tax=Rhizobium mesoamericanum TaxID=1079800 RepID=UPI0027854290|nr:ABC transporter permease [Rhizobium mesoamericanum]MDQ0563184.1 simple sugar transport system permease protein [Rhizobium mesoamericanum]
MDYLTIVFVAASALRLAVPLIFAAMGGLFAEKSGVIDIGLEGKMLFGAFAAGACAAAFGSSVAGLAGAIAAGVLLALAQAFASIHLRGNQLVIGIAINIIASGLTAFLGIAWYQRGGQTPQLDTAERFLPITLPGAETFSNLPIIGPLYVQIISGQTIFVYGAFLLVIITWIVIYRTRFGLRLQACGDKPEAVDTAGVSVFITRYLAFTINGALCGIGGAYFALVQGGAFYKDMTAGQGYMALAAVIFGNWRPGRVLAACLLFAVADAAQGRMQGAMIGDFAIPTQIIQALPYVLTLLLLAGIVGRAEGPLEAGRPYIKGER